MNFNNLLNQVLGSVKQAGEQISKSDNMPDTITKVGGGAAAVGVLSMLLGRGGGSSLAKVGSLAALGSLAYQAYQNYQKNNGNVSVSDLIEGAFSHKSEQVAEQTSNVILRTMIAIAACDGVIDEQERQAILSEGGSTPEIQQWIIDEMAQPASVEVIAQQVGNNPPLASEVYLAARMVCGAELSRKEIVFLSQLAQALNLDDKLVEQLEKQAGF